MVAADGEHGVSPARLEACSLAAGPFPPAARRCNWCGVELQGRRTRWCSDQCSSAYGDNHWWTQAREVALARDDHRCVKCGSDGTAPEATAWLVFCFRVAPPPRPVYVQEWAVERGLTPGAQDVWRQWHEWHSARMARWKAAEAIVAAEVKAHRLEVNHKVPILGRHAESGCHHHVEGLETLCHPCHVQVTAAQFGHRLRTIQNGAQLALL